MKTWISYDPSTGVIRQVSAGDTAPVIDALETIEAAEPINPREWRVVDGALQPYTPPPPTLDQVKAAKNAEINAARLSANRGTFTFQGKEIACDELSRSDIDGANGIITLTGALPAGWPGGWKTVDNDYVAIPTVAVWTQFYAAMVAQGTANFTKAQTLKAQVAAATTAAEVEAVTW